MPQSPNSKNSDKPEEKVYSQKDVDTRVVLKSKPEPKYTIEACRKGIVGFVLLQAIFAASGNVTNIEVLEGLPGGLTESAEKSARKIKFKPAMKDGRRVSISIKLEYNLIGILCRHVIKRYPTRHD
ncbi:MAG: energy transducer TonB [Pyrinomonadaceae bacterium]